MGEDVWEGHIEGLEQGLVGVGRSGDAKAVTGAFHDQLHGAQRL